MPDAWNPPLVDALARVRSRITQIRERGDAIGEQDTKASLIEPVLSALGWRLDDLDEVRREYRGKSKDNPAEEAAAAKITRSRVTSRTHHPHSEGPRRLRRRYDTGHSAVPAARRHGAQPLLLPCPAERLMIPGSLQSRITAGESADEKVWWPSPKVLLRWNGVPEQRRGHLKVAHTYLGDPSLGKRSPWSQGG